MTDIDGMVYQIYPDCHYRSKETCDLSTMEPLCTIRHSGYSEVAYVSRDHKQFTVMIRQD